MDIEEIERECMCPGYIQVRLGTGDRLLYRRYWTLGFHAIRRISWLAVALLASQGKKKNSVLQYD